MRSRARVWGLCGAGGCSKTECGGVCSPEPADQMVADGAPCYPVVVVVGCVTRDTTGREKEAFAGDRVGERDSLLRKIEKGVGLASGRDLNVWRLARSGAQYCAPKATLKDHIAQEMEPSGLNAPRTSHSECHTSGPHWVGSFVSGVYPWTQQKHEEASPNVHMGPPNQMGVTSHHQWEPMGSNVGASPYPCYTDRIWGTHTPKTWHYVNCLPCGEGTDRLRAMIHQGGLEQGLNVSGSRGVGTNAPQNNHKNNQQYKKNVRSRLQKGTAENQLWKVTFWAWKWPKKSLSSHVRALKGSFCPRREKSL